MKRPPLAYRKLRTTVTQTQAQTLSGVCWFANPYALFLFALPGENYGDPSGKLWMMYLTEAEKEDREIAERWKGDTDSILVFVSARPSIFYIYST